MDHNKKSTLYSLSSLSEPNILAKLLQSNVDLNSSPSNPSHPTNKPSPSQHNWSSNFFKANLSSPSSLALFDGNNPKIPSTENWLEKSNLEHSQSQATETQESLSLRELSNNLDSLTTFGHYVVAMCSANNEKGWFKRI